MRTTRRRFMAGVSAAGAAGMLRAAGANDRIRVGVMGIRGRGGFLAQQFAQRDDVQVVWLCDVNSQLFKDRTARVERAQGTKPRTAQDLRTMLDDPELDAMINATPDHWHALGTIIACQAGKDVYVEKPLSHNVHEGRIAVEVARKHKRVVQYGTGAGSLGDRIAALAKQGTYGKLLVSRGLCYKGRGSIGFRQTENPPEGLAFDIWTGPAPAQP